MKLINLKPIEKEIKSVIYINDKNIACVAYSDFDNYKQLYGEDTVTIYKPNAEQTAEIIKILQDSNESKSNRFTPKQTEYLLRNLTDVELDDCSDEDFEEISDNPPNDVLACIGAEFDDIATNIIAKMYNATIKMDMMPEPIKEVVYASRENGKLELENAIVERELQELREQKQKELEELEEQLKSKTKKATKSKSKK